MLFRVSLTGAPGPAVLERYLGAYGHQIGGRVHTAEYTMDVA